MVKILLTKSLLGCCEGWWTKFGKNIAIVYKVFSLPMSLSPPHSQPAYMGVQFLFSAQYKSIIHCGRKQDYIPKFIYINIYKFGHYLTTGFRELLRRRMELYQVLG